MDGPDGAGEPGPLDVLVLAGGTGQRLGGASKPDVVVRGARLLDHVLNGVAAVPVVAAPGSGRTQSPERPPDFAVTIASRRATPRSTPLTMSTTARPATVAAVSASISTPVRSAVRTVAQMRTPPSSTARSTLHPCTPMTCASGSRSGTLLAAAIPATGPPNGGSSRAWSTPSGTSTSAGATTTILPPPRGLRTAADAATGV